MQGCNSSLELKKWLSRVLPGPFTDSGAFKGLDRGYIGIVENSMETAIQGLGLGLRSMFTPVQANGVSTGTLRI